MEKHGQENAGRSKNDQVFEFEGKVTAQEKGKGEGGGEKSE